MAASTLLLRPKVVASPAASATHPRLRVACAAAPKRTCNRRAWKVFGAGTQKQPELVLTMFAGGPLSFFSKRIKT